MQEVKEFESLVELLEDLEREGITGIERRRHMENFLMRKSRLHGRPYCASFELTPLCNFDCKMCYMHLTKEQMEQEGRILTTEEWLDIARQAVDAGVANFDLTGGECLTHPGFKDIYLYLVNRGVNVAVLTNGQLITDEHIELFRKYPTTGVQISLYGSSEEAYKKVTGRNAFGDVMRSIEKLKKARIRIHLSVTPNRFMQDDAEALLGLLHALNVEYTIGSSTLPARPETRREIGEYIVDNSSLINISKMETRYRRDLANTLRLEPTKPYHYRIKGQESFLGTPCASGAANFHINWKGEMTPCVAYYAVSKSVLENSVEEAWEWIRDTMTQYREPEECKDCDLKNGCIVCCAEKTAGVLNGKINPWVCKRQREILRPTGSEESKLMSVDQKGESSDEA